MNFDQVVKAYDLQFWFDEGKKCGVEDKWLDIIISLISRYGVVGTLGMLDRDRNTNSIGASEAALMFDSMSKMLSSVCSCIDIEENNLTIFVHKSFEVNECCCLYV